MHTGQWQVWHRRGVAVLLALILVGALTTQVAQAAPIHSTTSPHTVVPVAGQFRESCYRLRVQLNGNQTPTATCLLKEKPKPGDITPNISETTCNTTDMQLFEDANYAGTAAEICFAGTGYTNLNNYWIFWPFTTWAEVVSSYKTGKWTGHFSGGDNDAAPYYGLQDHVLCSWIGPTWNDKAKGLKINGTGSHPQTFC